MIKKGCQANKPTAMWQVCRGAPTNLTCSQVCWPINFIRYSTFRNPFLHVSGSSLLAFWNRLAFLHATAQTSSLLNLVSLWTSYRCRQGHGQASYTSLRLPFLFRLLGSPLPSHVDMHQCNHVTWCVASRPRSNPRCGRPIQNLTFFNYRVNFLWQIL